MMVKPIYTDAEIVRQIVYNTRPEDPADWGRRTWENGPDLYYSYPTNIGSVRSAADNNSGNQEEHRGFVYDAQQIAWAPLVGRAFEAWDELIALNLNPVNGPISDIQVAFSTNTRGGGSYMAANVNDLGDDEVFNTAQIWLNPAFGQFNTTPPNTWNAVVGNTGYETMLHEIGHALGLFHPGPYNASDENGNPQTITYSDDAVFRQDTVRYTIMSYFNENDDASVTNWQGARPSTPMVYDILAIQAKYGADLNTRTGNDTYGFNSTFATTGQDAIYNWGATSRPVLTIWDARGIDTLDTSGFTGVGFGFRINLNPGTYSSVGAGMWNNLGIAFNAWIENAVGGTGADSILGNALDNLLEGGASGDTIDGGDGFDIASYRGTGAGVRVDLANNAANRFDVAARDQLFRIEGLLGGNFGDTFSGDGAGNLLDGAGGNDLLTGRDGADTLRGGIGSDVLNGGRGADRLEGGTERDTATYASAAAGVVANLFATTPGNILNSGEAAGDSFDSIEDLTGSAFHDTLLGDGGGNLLQGMNGNDSLFGNAGADTLLGGLDNDTIGGGLGADRIDGGRGFDLVDFSNAVAGLVVSLDLARAAESTGEAAGDRYTSIERLRGSAFADTLIGSSAGETLEGNFGQDRLEGGGSDDTYTLFDYTHVFSGSIYVGGAWDSVVEAAGGGVDTVLIRRQADRLGFLTVSNYTLPAHVENGVVDGDLGFSLVGNVGDNRLTGGRGNDRFVTGDGADTLDGGLGWDTLYGEFGDDTYVIGDVFDWYSGEIYVGAFRDEIAEPLNGGIDTVITTAAWSNGFGRYIASHTLGANVENGVVVGDIGFGLVGNVLANALSGGGGDDRIVAGDAADTLAGGLGADTLYGEFGDDTYILKDVTEVSGLLVATRVWDTILEAAPGGIDTVLVERASYLFAGSIAWRTDYRLPDFIENGRVTGAEAFTLLGNPLDNRLTGNNAWNFLVGEGGDDNLLGMGGDDALNGGPGADRLSGGAGADTLNGAAGRDLLTGDADADIFVLDQPGEPDTVADFAPGADRILLTLASLDPAGTRGLVAGSLADQPGRFVANLSGQADTIGLAQIIYETDAGRLWFDADGARGVARSVMLGSFTDAPALTAADIWLA